jgi:Zn-finger nucleic acid-binding protein
MTLECRRCDAVRVDLYGRSTAGKLNGGSFTKLRAGYDYPKGYTFDRKDHAADRPNNSDYYKELFARYGKAE